MISSHAQHARAPHETGMAMRSIMVSKCMPRWWNARRALEVTGPGPSQAASRILRVKVLATLSPHESSASMRCSCLSRPSAVSAKGAGLKGPVRCGIIGGS
eukprot:2257974-Pyramimonas_sp.AAC.1